MSRFQPSAKRASTPPSSALQPGDRGRVLVVDDEANARNALAELLRDEGYITEVAGDGQHALRALESFDADVVLTDLKMPVMDGLKLL
jgi:CheY-like chemotaxis protein